MKLFKRLFSYLIAFTMVLSLATLFGGNVHAADNAQHVITINNAPTGRTYAAYQIFNGDYSKGTLSNIGWGNDVDYATLLSELAKDTTNFSGITAESSARNVAEAMTSETDTDQAKAFAKYAEASIKKNDNGFVSKEENGTTTITVNGSGYYLVKDTTTESNQSSKHESYTRYIVQVVGTNTSINLKGTVPTVEKKVKDKNDSTGETSGWQDSADADINDNVEYQITGTMPSNIADYSSYKYVFTDTMSKGLTYTAKNAKITIDGKDVTSSFTENVEAVTKKDETTGKVEATGETKVTWSIDDIKNITDPDDHTKKIAIASGTKVVVTYDAQLNDKAVIGAAGNPNTVDLTYSNNPNKGGDGETGKTPEDKNIVFTYEAVVNKVDGNNTPLAGAKFDLLKKVGENWTTVAAGIEAKEVKDAETGKTTYTAEYKGLDDGTYKLHESKTPDGYNTADDIEFTISATHDLEAKDPKLTELKVSNSKLSANTNAGTITTNVVNKSGSTLPSTGGMGTTLLYVAGGILVACAAAYVVLNKKRA